MKFFRKLVAFVARWPRPTRMGWYFLGAGVLMVLAGNIYHEERFVLLGCMPLAMLVLNALVAWFGLRRIGFKRKHAGYTHVGESFDVTLMVHNSGRFPMFVMALEDDRHSDQIRDDAFVLVMAVGAGMVQRISYVASFRRRGRKRLRKLKLSSSFPFGLVTCRRDLSFRTEMMVYPRPVRLSAWLESELLNSARYFGESSVARMGQEEVFGLREYRPGQNVARIHWKTTARVGKPMLLEMEGRQDASFLLILDTSPIGDPSTLRRRLESAIGVLAGLTWFLTRQGVLFRFAWYGSKLHVSPSGRGDRHYHGVMEQLALAGFADKGLGHWIPEVGTRRGETPVVVTLAPKETTEARLATTDNALVISTSDAEFARYIRLDAMGRRSVDGGQLERKA